MNPSLLSVAIVASVGLLLTISAASPECSAEDSDVYLISNGDFNSAANWDNGLVPSLAVTPPKTVPNIYGIDDGHSTTFSGGTTTVFGLRVGSGAKEHQHPDDTTRFGRLTMTGGSLEVIGSAAMGWFGVGRERENVPVGGDYNKNSIVDAADYTVWRDRLGSAATGCAPSAAVVSCADGDRNGTIEQADYDFWKAHFGNVVKGGEFIMTGTSTLTANGVIIGERTRGLLSVGPMAVVNLRDWIVPSPPDPLNPPHFGGSQDIRIGNYGPAFEQFGQPGLDGDGLVDVQGTLNANLMRFSENGAKGELRLSGNGKVNLNGALNMTSCLGCYALPAPSDPDYPVILALLALRSAKVSILGSSGTFNVGLDPDPAVVDPTPSSRDLLAASATAKFSFTADAGGVTPITIVDNVGEISGTAYIGGAKLELNLDAYTSASPLTLINAPAGLVMDPPPADPTAHYHLVGTFGSVTFLGSKIADPPIYDYANGDVYLTNIRIRPGAGTGSLASSAVPEPSSLMLMTLALGLLSFFVSERARQQIACRRGYQWIKVRA